MSDLPACVHTGVGTPCTDQTDRLSGDATEGRLGDLLHAASGLLSCQPAYAVPSYSTPTASLIMVESLTGAKEARPAKGTNPA